MAYSNSTNNLKLPQWAPDDKPTWLTDMNGAFRTIDSNATKLENDFNNVSSKADNLGITVASNTEAIHQNATSIVAANNAIASLTAKTEALLDATTETYQWSKVEGSKISSIDWAGLILFRFKTFCLVHYYYSVTLSATITEYENIMYIPNIPLSIGSVPIIATKEQILDTRVTIGDGVLGASDLRYNTDTNAFFLGISNYNATHPNSSGSYVFYVNP